MFGSKEEEGDSEEAESKEKTGQLAKEVEKCNKRS